MLKTRKTQPIAKSTNSDPPNYSEKDKPEGEAMTQAHQEKDKPEKKATTQVMQQHETYVQVCPHERLSFERFRRIQGLMRDEQYRRLDALSAMAKYHEDMQCARSFESRVSDQCMDDLYQICRPKAPTSETPRVHGQAAYMFLRDGVFPDGLKMLSIWKIDFGHHQYKSEVFAQIQDLLEPFHVWLCPHRRLHDGIIVSKFVSLVVPKARDPDPVRRLEINKELRQCQSCDSTFGFRMEGMTCVVKVERKIKAKTAKDASWLRHCSRTEDQK